MKGARIRFLQSILLTGCLLLSVTASFPALASDSLRDEIIQEVVDPCYLDAVLRNPVEGVSDQQMFELLKIMQADNTEQVVDSLLPIVSKLGSKQERAAMYKIGKQICIQASRRGK